MIQEEIYAKDISRPINGVIKASSTSDLTTEVDEFVVTSEQLKLLPDLFSTLVEPASKSYVWISGDFGSGKSHLLKILSYVLANNFEIDGKKCADVFAEKASADFELKGNIIKACRIPTKSILFNIQEIFDGLGKTKVSDPVLAIFMKEFNRMLGYDEKQYEVANIERYFEGNDKYAWLKSEYQNRFGQSWEDARKSIQFRQQNLAEIFAEMEGTTLEVALNNIKTQLNNYRLDIDGFADLVKLYLDKNPGLRLIFFVDEVAQFVGKDVHRMLSLQTIAEDLADRTEGRCILMVTSQMDIDATLGNLEQQQENDFSRIQGRFTTRVNLTSANADEVIQRRLLEKKPEPRQILRKVYDEQKVFIKSMFNFGDNSQFRTNYKGDAHFAIDFPFVDYQFDLLQRSIIELSKNNAFSGKHTSVGERSLLTITQQVAITYKDKDLDHIVQFCNMYEGLRGILQTKIQSDIQQAERTLNDDLALKVLKTLFLVKYVKGFPSTKENITKILMPTLDTDFPAFMSDIQEALNVLVRKSYIEKGANDEYHYQTNEEKDIETEIKNEDLSADALNNELKKIFSADIFDDSKIKLSTFKIFSYGRIVDEQQDGRDADIYIHFITPLTQLAHTDQQAMCAYSMQHPDQLVVVLGEDKYMAEDLAMYKKADKCLLRLLSSNNDNYRQQIISDKRRINSQRRENIVARLSELTKNARLYIAGQEITPSKITDIKTRLSDGMKELVDQVYRNLKMLTIEYDDSMLKNIISSTTLDTALCSEGVDVCAQEVFNHIQRNKQLSIRSKVKDLVDYFRQAPYGWYQTATLCLLAKLYKTDKISMQSSGGPVADRDLYYHLTNSGAQATLIVDIEEAISQSQVTKLKNLYREFFNDENCAAQTAKDVHTRFIERLNKEIDTLRSVKAQWPFKFVEPVEQVVEKLQIASRSVFPSLYAKTKQLEDILDDKELADTISQFVASPQFEIFKKIDTLKKGNLANVALVNPELQAKLDKIYHSATPWTQMAEGKQALEAMTGEIKSMQDEAHGSIKAQIEEKRSALLSLPAYPQLTDEQKDIVAQIFDKLSAKADAERFIGNLRAMTTDVTNGYNHGLDYINRCMEQANAKKMVSRYEAMDVNFDKALLETKEDVQRYIYALHARLDSFIDDNKNIMLN